MAQHAPIIALDKGAVWYSGAVNGCMGRNIEVEETVGHKF